MNESTNTPQIRSYTPRTKEEMDILWTLTQLPDEIWAGYLSDLNRHGFTVAEAVLMAFPAVMAELRELRVYKGKSTPSASDSDAAHKAG